MKCILLLRSGLPILALTGLLNACSPGEPAPEKKTADDFPAQVSKPVLSSKEQVAVRDFAAWLEDGFERKGPPGLAVAVVKDTLVAFRRTLGVLDVNTGDSVNTTSVFRLASVSKGFAPVLTGILVQQGCLNWDDLVVSYLPDLVLKDSVATRSLRLRHVLSHTTGLPRHTYSNLLNMSVPYEEILPMLKDVDIAHPVGTWYNYQNVAYSLIGDVIEQATGMTYTRSLAEKLFEPVGMVQASASYGAVAGCENIAMPHGPDANGYHRIPLRDKFYSVAPAAGVNASLQDMERWLALLMGHREEVIDSAMLQYIFERQVDVAPVEGVMRAWRPMEVSAYGLGWRLVEKEGRHYVFHGGFINGYRAEIGFCKESGLGIVLLGNGSSSFVGQALPHFFKLLLRQGA